MEWVSNWIEGIIIAVIIATIIEMILPEGNCKKYIKVVIGVYILFSMISPVITKITGNDFRVSDIFNLEEYIEVSKNSGSMQNQLASENQNQIKQIYIDSIKNDIKEKVKNKGYMTTKIEIEVENDEQYTLKNIHLQMKKAETKDEEENTNTVVNEIESVNQVQIKVGNETTNQESTNENNNQNSKTQKNNLSSQDIKQVKEYLSGIYEIQIKNIHINE